MKNRSKGITLIALVITIIVLLILAGVTINTLLGDNGIMKKASSASEETKRTQAFEELKIKVMGVQTEKQGLATLQDVVEALKVDTEYEYVVSLEKIATIKGTVPDASNATEIYVIHKDYQFKIDDNLKISVVGLKQNSELDNRETDLGTQHITDDEWTAAIPEDNWFAKEEYYKTNWQGEGTKESPYLITTEQELAGLSYQVAKGEKFDSSTYFQLTTDLSMGKHIWVPIGGKNINVQEANYYSNNFEKVFSGNFNGGGFTISGLYFNNEQSNYGNYIGLFGRINVSDRSTIENLSVKDSFLKGYNYIGGIIGYCMNVTLQECNNEATLYGKGNVGGLIGHGNFSKAVKCSNKGLIAGITESGMFGGLIGEGKVDCNSSYNEGKISVISKQSVVNVGGINGSTVNNTQTINCYNIGDIYVETDNEKSTIGGIYGTSKDGACRNCFNIGKIISTQGMVGGIVGKSENSTRVWVIVEYCYFKKNTTTNNLINTIGYNNGTEQLTVKMVGYFDDIETTTFTYTNDTSEESGYEGDLVTKLNKWVSVQGSTTTYLNWKIDEKLKYPVLY